MSVRRLSEKTQLSLVGGRRVFVFTDVEPASLDQKHYDWRPMVRTLAELRAKNIPLILCTSKSRAEVDRLRRQMQHSDPCIAENGGVLLLPWKWLGKTNLGRLQKNDLALQLGWNYPDVLRVLKELARSAGVSVRGFHQMTAAEIARKTGLALAQARKAMLRESSEPFEFVNAGEKQVRAFLRAARERRMQVAKGARFWHLTIGSDKGQAMALLTQLAQIGNETPIRTIAAGNSPIDLPMLAQADLPILMPDHKGDFDSLLLHSLPFAQRAPGSGAGAWAQAIDQALLRPNLNPNPTQHAKISSRPSTQLQLQVAR